MELRNLIEHMILSHHGQLEFGSPKLPIFPEALLLHYLDDMDSKMECMRALIEKDPQAEGYFTAYSPALARVALRKARYLDANGAEADRQSRRTIRRRTNSTRSITANRTCFEHWHALIPAARPRLRRIQTRARRQFDFRREASTGAS